MVHMASLGQRTVLVFVEGTHDIMFLAGISHVLSKEHANIPDLAQLENEGRIIFVPTSGNPQLWARRLAGLSQPEFHLYDREVMPVSAESTANQSTPYALDQIQLRGRTGEVVASDGKQLLVQSGFQFGWQEELLVPASPVFDWSPVSTRASKSRIIACRRQVWRLSH